tara:strand:+ start:7908 stop:8252 length:345 start_codon:yes stop_codon:yes gene_type:complete
MSYTILQHLEMMQGKYLKTEESIIYHVSEYLDENPIVKSKTRKRYCVDERTYLIMILKKHTKLSLLKVGAIVGKPDHAVVLHYLKRHNVFTETNDIQYKENTKKFTKIFKNVLP